MGLLSLSALLIYASSAQAHGPITERIASITKEIDQDPRDASLYLRRGELHFFHNDWKAALKDYDQAAALNPELTLVDLYRGKTMLSAGWLDQAREALNSCLSIFPNHPEALLTRARVLAKLSHYQDASNDYTRFLDYAEVQRPEHFLERAQALYEAGREYWETALRSLDEGISRLGHVVTIQLYAINLELQLERYDRALQRLENIAVQSARKEKWLLRKGKILRSAGRLDEARRAFEKALNEIETLPPRRRNTKATQHLEGRIRLALQQ